MKNLSLIQVIVLLHDHRRPKQKRKNSNFHLQQFEHTSENINLAYQLAHEILRKTIQN